MQSRARRVRTCRPGLDRLVKQTCEIERHRDDAVGIRAAQLRIEGDFRCDSGIGRRQAGILEEVDHDATKIARNRRYLRQQ